MRIANVFVSVGVADHPAGCTWWSTLIGRAPDRRPMPSCCEWDLTDSVFLQVLDNPRNGALVHGPGEIPDGEFSAVCTDPQGVVFGLVGPRAADNSKESRNG